MRRRLLTALGAAAMAVLLTAGPSLACGGLIGPNGAVNLLRTTTLAGYHGGVEHYVTAFEFAGGGGSFGSIVPLPDVPTKVEKGGAWTLQRLVRETDPQPVAFDLRAAAAGAEAQEILKTKIDALDITVLKGGADEVGLWAKNHGFRLPPDSPEVLDFYARRSQIFLAASFDADAAKARGQSIGDGTPVHITIPTNNPWVPLRILGLGKAGVERIQASVYLLTDARPALLPAPAGNGMSINRNAPASETLLADLRSDEGMGWVPETSWLTKVAIDAEASQLTYDLAIDATGAAAPSRVRAGLSLPDGTSLVPTPSVDVGRLLLAAAVAIGGVVLMVFLARRPTTTSAV
jgi:hypothetical protein